LIRILTNIEQYRYIDINISGYLMNKSVISFFYLLLIIVINSCSKYRTPSLPPIEELKSEWLLNRYEKDEEFRNGIESPLPDSIKVDFPGLKYFPFNPHLIFVVKLQEYMEKEKMLMGTSTGESREYIRYGYIEFIAEKQINRLSIYRSEKSELSEHPFLPFTDRTTGKQTYGAGRYLEIIEISDDYYLINFNNAYNPYCVYNTKYSCPIPPEENGLSIAIHAGELYEKTSIIN